MYQLKLSTRPSKIHGNGLFTNEFISTGDRIVLVADIALKGKQSTWITPLGAMINHSRNGNGALQQDGTQFFLVALRDIAPNEELTSDYTKAPHYFSRDVRGFTEI